MSLARLPMRIAAVLAQRGARVAEGPSAQKTISQNQRAAEATQRFFFFRSGVCSSKAVDASPRFVFRGIDRETKLLLQGSGHGAPHSVRLPAGRLDNLSKGGAAGPLEEINQQGLLGAAPRLTLRGGRLRFRLGRLGLLSFELDADGGKPGLGERRWQGDEWLRVRRLTIGHKPR